MASTAIEPTTAPLEALSARRDGAKRAGFSLTRRKREQDFFLFKRMAKSFFTDPPFEAGHQRMAARSSFGLAIGGEEALEPRAATRPGRPLPAATDAVAPDARTVEIFYGDRVVSSYQRLAQKRLAHEWANVTETGASLLYAQGDDGAVSLYLYPASTPNMKAEEDAILLSRFGDLESMTGRGALERHWRAFRAYAEVTSLDGEPSFVQQLQVAWLRYTRSTVVDGRRQPAPALRSAEAGLRFTAAIVASAGLLSLFV